MLALRLFVQLGTETLRADKSRSKRVRRVYGRAVVDGTETLHI